MISTKSDFLSSNTFTFRYEWETTKNTEKNNKANPEETFRSQNKRGAHDEILPPELHHTWFIQGLYRFSYCKSCPLMEAAL